MLIPKFQHIHSLLKLTNLLSCKASKQHSLKFIKKPTLGKICEKERLSLGVIKKTEIAEKLVFNYVETIAKQITYAVIFDSDI